MSGAIGEDSGPGAGTSPGRSGKSCGACPGDGGGFKSGSAGSGEGASGSGTGLSGCGLIDAMPPPHGRPRSRSARPLLLLGLIAGALARLRGMSGVGLVALTFLVLLRRPVLVAVVLGIHGGLPHGRDRRTPAPMRSFPARKRNRSDLWPVLQRQVPTKHRHDDP